MEALDDDLLNELDDLDILEATPTTVPTDTLPATSVPAGTAQPEAQKLDEFGLPQAS
ncbi:hypothetical protein SARC_17237 [Sphaeroforma arctica JP610]|uniref:Uncharacterized protein n=1 Tax=Sphaeroforma arctica JP610 TaxID=667725 RepID=A0A0L0F0K2_9EUKA|nr:hypothetical protein SARC_17237 [Sphaeroforma arctica JP610]KNC70240.1 hypothetical protein SARC_17237 [Sphaeroforma arctica JP610]|eukprot:XP_014144142.1 hypothetical protein SARC_17237 [Sphaeroforma arctica JP610]